MPIFNPFDQYWAVDYLCSLHFKGPEGRDSAWVPASRYAQLDCLCLAQGKCSGKKINKGRNKIYKQICLEKKPVIFPIQSVRQVDQSVINAKMLILKEKYIVYFGTMYVNTSHRGVLELTVSLLFFRLVKIILLDSLEFLLLFLFSFFWLPMGMLRHCKIDFYSVIWIEALLRAINQNHWL